MDRVKFQYRTIKKAFMDMDRNRKSYISPELFEEIIESWGFEATSDDVRQLFDFLDADGDGKISMQDLKIRIGFEILPQEGAYFRQDVRPLKKPICAY